MGEHRSRIGAALLASVAVFGAAAASTAASNAAGWDDPIVLGLLAFALLCLIGALIAFRPSPSGNAKMNRLIGRQFGVLKRRRIMRRLLRRPVSKELDLMLTTEPPPLAPDAPLSSADRQRIPKEMEQRLASEIHDPTLRALDKTNNERQAEAQDNTSPPPNPGGKALEPSSRAELADRLARLHRDGRTLRRRIKPDTSDPMQLLSSAMSITAYPAASVNSEREARSWSERVQNQLTLSAPRFVPEWERGPALPMRPILVPAVVADGRVLVRLLDGRLGLLENIIGDLRGGK
jgi:hypothetical protein